MRISDWSSDVCSSDLNRAQVDPHHLLHHGNQDDQARALHLPVAAELEPHAALVFAQHLDCADQQYEQQQDRGVGDHGHGLPPSTSARGSTCSTRPSTARTHNRWPRRTGCPDLARQSSPRTCTRPLSLKSSRATASRPIISPIPVPTAPFPPRVPPTATPLHP